MINEEKVVSQFVKYCRIVLKYEKVNYYQQQTRRAERECYLEMLGEDELEKIAQTSDTYHTDSFSVTGYEIGIEDGCLAQALRKLSERYLQIVLMYYFVGLKDAEIAREFGLTPSTICVQRHNAVKMLRGFMEGADNG